MGHATEAFVLFLFAYLFLNVVHGWSLNVRNIVIQFTVHSQKTDGRIRSHVYGDNIHPNMYKYSHIHDMS